MDNPKNKIAERIKETNNVLVTVSANPSVDQLAAAIGLTLLLTKLNKHATAVFSGEVPSTIEFLKPEETLEANTDSLRDFIIALDKAKADKLRYKVEDKMVKIFITPYRTSISQDDLEFSEGDFNVDIVIALGVHAKEELDDAITSHGRILHDATVATINTKENSELGSLNWTDPQASSLCEMVVALADLLKANSLDAQMATALLTGIVAETERFSNAKTTSVTMNASAKLMTAGANQQLVATKLQGEEPTPAPPEDKQDGGGQGQAPPEAGTGEDGSLQIDHEEEKKQPEQIPEEKPASVQQKPPEEPSPPPPPPPPPPSARAAPPPPPPPPPRPPEPEIHTEHRKFLDQPPRSQHTSEPSLEEGGGLMPEDSKLIMQPPTMGGQLSATSSGEFEPSMDQLTLPPVRPPILHHDSGEEKKEKAPPKRAEPKAAASKPAPPPPPADIPKPSPPPPPPPEPTPPPPQPPPPPEPPKEPEPAKLPQAVIDVMDDQTLDAIEGSVKSPHRLLKDKDKTLKDIEKTVGSPHLDYEAHESEPPPEPLVKAIKAEGLAGTPPPPPPAPEPLLAQITPKPLDASTYNKEKEPEVQPPPADASKTDQARDAVAAAINTGGDGRSSPPALQSIGATNFGVDLHQPAAPAPDIHIDPDTGMLSYPQTGSGPQPPTEDNPPAPPLDPNAPPPVPPPMMPLMPPQADAAGQDAPQAA